MGPTRPKLYKIGSSRTLFVLLGSDLVFLCPGSGQESREVLAVALPVRQFAENILHPCSRVDICSPAGANEGVYDGYPICGGVVAAEEIVLPAESKRPDGILDEVVVDVDPAVIHIARQTGKKTVGIGKGLSEPALEQDLCIGFLEPLLEHPDCGIGYLTALFLTLFRAQAFIVRIALHLVQFSYEEYALHGKPFVLFQRVDELSPDMRPAAVHGYPRHLFKLVICLIAVALHVTPVSTQDFTGDVMATAAPVIPEHDIPCDSVPDVPLVTLSGLVFLVIDYRYHALVDLDVFA